MWFGIANCWSMQLDSGKLRYSHRFADLGSRAPRICLFFSRPCNNLIPIGYAGKYLGGRKFRHKPPFLSAVNRGCRKEINSDKKEKPPLAPIVKGKHCRDSKSQLSRCFSILSRMYLVPVLPCSTVFLSNASSLQECIWPNPHPRTKAEGGKYLIPEN